MITHIVKTQENKNQSQANAVSQKQSGGEATSLLVDNRPVAILQRKLQVMANNSLQMKQVAQLQAMADNHTSQQQQPVFQLAGGAHAYDAGAGEYWHVHHGDHVKFGGLGGTRINFGGRNRSQILRQLRGQRNVPPRSHQGAISYRQCVNWILRNK
jgi:hypothetical protein